MARKILHATFIKSTAIKSLARSTGKRGKELAAALKSKHPEAFAEYDLDRLAGYCSTVLSQAKSSKPKKTGAVAPAALSQQAASYGHSPFMSQLKTLTAMIGKQAVKDVVDKL